MAVRQYVGARYVPKFKEPDINWEADMSYEAMTIVTYNNDSYTSKVPVPANIGTPPNNPDYWVLTGNFNGQLADYAKKTAQAVEDAEQAKKDASEAKSEVGTVQTNLDNEITARQDADKALEEKIASVGGKFLSDLNGKRILIIGDSISDETTMAPNWVTRLRNEITAEGVNITVNNISKNGSSWCGWAVASESAILETLTDDYDIIIIALGTNDYQGQWGIGYITDTDYASSTAGYNGYNAIACEVKVLAKLREKCPNAIQYYCTPIRYELANNKIKLPFYVHAFASTATHYGCRIIDWCDMPMYAPQAIGTSFNGYTSDTDYLHPSNVYSPLMMRYIMESIKKGGQSTWRYFESDYAFLDETGKLMITVRYGSDGRINIRFASEVEISGSGIQQYYLAKNVPYPICRLTRYNTNLMKLESSSNIGYPAFLGGYESVENGSLVAVFDYDAIGGSISAVYCNTFTPPNSVLSYI